MSESARKLGENKQNSKVVVTSGLQVKMPTLVPPVLREVGKLAAGVAAVSTTNSQAANSNSSATGNPRNKCALQPGHSLMDWIRLGSSGKDLTGVGSKAGHLAVTEKEMALHNTEKDAWLAIRGKVYNVTAYLPFHPGGPEELLKGAGKDATSLFDQVHPWVNYDQILNKCLIGRLVTIDPSINKEALFLGVKSASSPPPVNLATSHQVAVQLPPPRFDWIQKLDYITTVFYTKAFANPFLEVFPSQTDNGVLILIAYEGTVFTNELIFDDKIEWPAQIKINEETGKIELVFKKISGRIWEKYGILRQNQKASGSLSGNIKYSYQVKDKKMISHNTVLLKLERNDGSKVVVPLGKHVRVFGEVSGGTQASRSYTPVPESLFSTKILGGAQTTCVCLMVKSYPKGNISRFLNGKNPGDLVYLSKPLGTFDLRVLEKRETFLLLAAGTGVTPMLSLIIFLLERRIKKCQFIRMLFFNKTDKDILFREQFDQLSQDDSRFQIDYVLSEPPATWQGYKNHISKDLIFNALQEHLKDTGYTIKDIFCCICGPDNFTILSQKLLQDLEFEEEQIHAFQG